MKHMAVILLFTISLFSALGSIGEEKGKCPEKEFKEKLYRFRLDSGIIFGKIDTVYCKNSTLEAWIHFAPWDSAIADECYGPGTATNDVRVAVWHIWLHYFYGTVHGAFGIFGDMDKYRAVIFSGERYRDENGVIRVRNKFPVAKLRMNRETYKEVNWEYIWEIWHYDGECYGKRRQEFLGVLDAYWVNEKYPKP